VVRHNIDPLTFYIHQATREGLVELSDGLNDFTGAMGGDVLDGHLLSGEQRVLIAQQFSDALTPGDGSTMSRYRHPINANNFHGLGISNETDTVRVMSGNWQGHGHVSRPTEYIAVCDGANAPAVLSLDILERSLRFGELPKLNDNSFGFIGEIGGAACIPTILRGRAVTGINAKGIELGDQPTEDGPELIVGLEAFSDITRLAARGLRAGAEVVRNQTLEIMANVQ
jgi:hypothetical protein